VVLKNIEKFCIAKIYFGCLRSSNAYFGCLRSSNALSDTKLLMDFIFLNLFLGQSKTGEHRNTE
jgi:hypothetical protein